MAPSFTISDLAFIGQTGGGGQLPDLPSGTLSEVAFALSYAQAEYAHVATVEFYASANADMSDFYLLETLTAPFGGSPIVGSVYPANGEYAQVAAYGDGVSYSTNYVLSNIIQYFPP